MLLGADAPEVWLYGQEMSPEMFALLFPAAANGTPLTVQAEDAYAYLSVPSVRMALSSVGSGLACHGSVIVKSSNVTSSLLSAVVTVTLQVWSPRATFGITNEARVPVWPESARVFAPPSSS